MIGLRHDAAKDSWTDGPVEYVSDEVMNEAANEDKGVLSLQTSGPSSA